MPCQKFVNFLVCPFSFQLTRNALSKVNHFLTTTSLMKKIDVHEDIWFQRWLYVKASLQDGKTWGIYLDWKCSKFTFSSWLHRNATIIFSLQDCVWCKGKIVFFKSCCSVNKMLLIYQLHKNGNQRPNFVAIYPLLELPLVGKK